MPVGRIETFTVAEMERPRGHVRPRLVKYEVMIFYDYVIRFFFTEVMLIISFTPTANIILL